MYTRSVLISLKSMQLYSSGSLQLAVHWPFHSCAPMERVLNRVLGSLRGRVLNAVFPSVYQRELLGKLGDRGLEFLGLGLLRDRIHCF